MDFRKILAHVIRGSLYDCDRPAVLPCGDIQDDNDVLTGEELEAYFTLVREIVDREYTQEEAEPATDREQKNRQWAHTQVLRSIEQLELEACV